MKTRDHLQIQLRLPAGLKWMLPVVFLFFSHAQLNAQVAVIVHQSVPKSELNKTELMDLFTGDVKRWNDDLPVVVIDLKSKGEIKDLFYDYLGKSPSRMKSIWLKKMLAGENDPPQAMKSEEEVLAKVASTPGAIGFISQSLVNKKVKTVVVIEKDST